MSTCPYCKAPIYKISYGECPSCNKNVVEFEGHYYKTSPTVTVVEHFEKLVSDNMSKENNTDIVFRIKRKGLMWRYECARAKQLIREVNYNLDFLLEVLTFLAQHKNYSWRFKDSLASVLPMLNAGVSIIRAKREKEKVKEARAKAFDNYLNEREDMLDV
jgi:hypothetical protein